ncbi:MAG: DUF3313 family protein [Steroidobacteraceae bacterium]
MKTTGHLSLMGAALLLAACATTPVPRQTWDGLEPYPQKKLDAVYVRPQADFARYPEILLDPLQVSFDRNWDPGSGSVSLRDVDTAHIKQVLAAEFRKVFEEAFSAGGRYRIVTAAGPGTLRISPAIVDLYINAPDRSMQTAGRVRSYTVDPGRMTLTADFRDGESGTLLARVVDRKQGVERGYFEITNSVTNVADARRAMKQWANAIRAGLDEAGTRPPTAGAR